MKAADRKKRDLIKWRAQERIASNRRAAAGDTLQSVLVHDVSKDMVKMAERELEDLERVTGGRSKAEAKAELKEAKAELKEVKAALKKHKAKR